MLKELEGPGTYSKQQTQLSSQKDEQKTSHSRPTDLSSYYPMHWSYPDFTKKQVSPKGKEKIKSLKSQSKYQNQIQK